MNRLLFSILIVFLLAGEAKALDLTMAEAVNMALQENRLLKVEESRVEAARESTSIAQKKLLPSLSLESYYTLMDEPDRVLIDANSFGPGTPPDSVEITDSRDMYSVSLVLRQPLFMGGRLLHTVRKNQAIEQRAEHALSQEANLLVRDVKTSYLEALNALLAEQTYRQLVATKTERLRVIRELSKEGYAKEEEVLQQETDLAFTEAAYFKAQGRRKLAFNRLKILLNVNEDEEITLKNRLYFATISASLKDLKETALNFRSDYKAQKAQLREAGEEITIARSDYFPEISLEGRFTQQKETSLNRDQIWLIGARLEWTLFDWGQTSADVNRAISMKTSQKYLAENLDRNIRIEVEEAWTTVRGKEQEVGAMEKQVKTAEFVLDKAIEGYGQGTITLAEVLEKEAKLVSSYNDYLASINSHGVAVSRLEASVASSLDHWLEPHQVYTPSFDYLTRNLKELSREQRTGENPFEEPKTASVISARIEPVKSTAYIIQVGAFKTNNRAQQFMKEHEAQLNGHQVEIFREDNWHKVQIIGFQNYAEAKDTLNTLGIKGYVKKGGNAPDK